MLQNNTPSILEFVLAASLSMTWGISGDCLKKSTSLLKQWKSSPSTRDCGFPLPSGLLQEDWWRAWFNLRPMTLLFKSLDVVPHFEDTITIDKSNKPIGHFCDFSWLLRHPFSIHKFFACFFLWVVLVGRCTQTNKSCMTTHNWSCCWTASFRQGNALLFQAKLWAWLNYKGGHGWANEIFVHTKQDMLKSHLTETTLHEHPCVLNSFDWLCSWAYVSCHVWTWAQSSSWWCGKREVLGFNPLNVGTKRTKKIACPSLLLPCQSITEWNCGCLWFLMFFMRKAVE